MTLGKMTDMKARGGEVTAKICEEECSREISILVCVCLDGWRGFIIR